MTQSIDLHEFFVQFQDHLAPKLDTYEQAIYLYIFRHSRLVGLDEVTIGFTSARHRVATGVGESGKPMSQKTAYEKTASLHTKGFITVVRTIHTGRVLRLHLPSEIPNLIPTEASLAEPDLEVMDFSMFQRIALFCSNANKAVASTHCKNSMRAISLLSMLYLGQRETMATATASQPHAKRTIRKALLQLKTFFAVSSGKAI